MPPPAFRFRLAENELDRLVNVPLYAFDHVRCYTVNWRVTDEVDGSQHHEGWWRKGHEREGAQALAALFRLIWPERFPATADEVEFPRVWLTDGGELVKGTLRGNLVTGVPR
jgi:hypothetical protein